MKTKKSTQNKKAASMKSSAKKTPKKSNKLPALLFALLFGAVGIYLISISSAATSPITVKAATYNILSQLYDGTSTKYDTWAKRAPRVANKISNVSPDIIGLQEVLYAKPIVSTVTKYSPQRADVIRFMTNRGYSYYTGSARNSEPIFWKKAIRGGGYTLLEKKEVLIVPENAKAKGPGARYLTYVRLSNGGKYISVFNYHYNHYRLVDAQPGALQKYFWSFKHGGDSVIFTGDFNGYDSRITKLIPLHRADSNASVDHILVSSNISTISWAKAPNGAPYASDHPLVYANIKIR